MSSRPDKDRGWTQSRSYEHEGNDGQVYATPVDPVRVTASRPGEGNLRQWNRRAHRSPRDNPPTTEPTSMRPASTARPRWTRLSSDSRHAAQWRG